MCRPLRRERGFRGRPAMRIESSRWELGTREPSIGGRVRMTLRSSVELKWLRPEFPGHHSTLHSYGTRYLIVGNPSLISPGDLACPGLQRHTPSITCHLRLEGRFLIPKTSQPTTTHLFLRLPHLKLYGLHTASPSSIDTAMSSSIKSESPARDGSASASGAGALDDKPRLTEEEKKQNHIASGDYLTTICDSNFTR